MIRNATAMAEEFWARAGGRPRALNPGRMAVAVERALPAAVLPIPNLSTATASALLDRIGASPCELTAVRALRGCVLAQGGRALILVDAQDPDDEKIMTISHEASHFMVHYLLPRTNAVAALGPRIVEVLDGARAPSTGEALAAAMRDVPLAKFRHTLERNGLSQRRLDGMEDEADHLAIELLAPCAALRRMSDRSPGALRKRFGLPAAVAANLSASLAPTSRGERGVLHLFGGGRLS